MPSFFKNHFIKEKDTKKILIEANNFSNEKIISLINYKFSKEEVYKIKKASFEMGRNYYSS